MRVSIGTTKGMVTEGGAAHVVSGGIDLQNGYTSTVTALAASHITGSRPGMYTLSGSGAQAILTYHLPDPSTVTGGVFGFRTTSADAHILSSSQVTHASISAASGALGNIGAANGVRLSFPAVLHSAVQLWSDGRTYNVVTVTGSFTLA